MLHACAAPMIHHALHLFQAQGTKGLGFCLAAVRKGREGRCP